MRYREAARKLKKLECEELARRGKGSHRVWHNPKTKRIAPLPDWGSKDLKLGTLRAVIKQLAWNGMSLCEPEADCQALNALCKSSIKSSLFSNPTEIRINPG